MRETRALVALVVVLSLGALACATPIADSGWDVTILSPSDATVQVMFDSMGDDKLNLELYKEFDSPVFDGLDGQPIALIFTKTEASAPNNIVIRDEYIKNSTGVTWYDYHMILSSQVEPIVSNEVVPQKIGFHPDFIFQGGVAGNPFEEVKYDDLSYQGIEYNNQPTAMKMDFGGGGEVPPDMIWQPGWGGDDTNNAYIITDLKVGDFFLLKEYPTIPEPATFVLFSIGMIPMLLNRKQKH